MTGICDCFGYGASYDVSFEQRYKLIKNAGFDCVELWRSDKFGRGIGYQQDVQLARNTGLYIEDIHAPFTRRTVCLPTIRTLRAHFNPICSL